MICFNVSAHKVHNLSIDLFLFLVSPYYKSKLKGIYSTALTEAQAEAKLLQDALEKITEIKECRSKTSTYEYYIFRVVLPAAFNSVIDWLIS